jgi:hypothetical protein
MLGILMGNNTVACTYEHEELDLTDAYIVDEKLWLV